MVVWITATTMRTGHMLANFHRHLRVLARVDSNASYQWNQDSYFNFIIDVDIFLCIYDIFQTSFPSWWLPSKMSQCSMPDALSMNAKSSENFELKISNLMSSAAFGRPQFDQITGTAKCGPFPRQNVLPVSRQLQWGVGTVQRVCWGSHHPTTL